VSGDHQQPYATHSVEVSKLLHVQRSSHETLHQAHPFEVQSLLAK
jgi:hypothetical protein